MNRYIIPANSKKSALILGFFTPTDLIIFTVGCAITIFALIFIKTANFGEMLIIVAPALISAFLVLPVPNYHNVMQLLTNIIMFFINRRRYYWKGWGGTDGE